MERSIAPAVLKFMLSEESAAQMIHLMDVRRSEDFAKEPAAIPGARWNDPFAIEQWSTHLNPEQEVILYCSRGGSESNSVVDALHARGIKARFIKGGLEAWKAAGGTIMTPV